MAGALAPVVWLMVLASLLFGAAGILDGIYPGGPQWSFEAYGGLGWTSYAFGIVNLLARATVRARSAPVKNPSVSFGVKRVSNS